MQVASRAAAFHWAWVILGVSFLDLFVNYSIRLGYGVILPEMIRELGLSRTAGGSIYNSYLFVYMALTPFAGFLTDRIGARRVIAVCSLILGAGAALMGTIEGLWSACLFYALVGLGATGMWTPVITVVQRWFAPDRRGLALGILSTGYGLGFAVSGLLLPVIMERLSWRHAWHLLGGAAFLLFFLNSGLLRSDPAGAGARPWGQRGEAEERPPLDGKAASSLGQVLNSGVFWGVGLSYFCVAYALYGLTTFMVDFARNQLGIPLEEASILATIHGIGQVAGVLLILPLSDRLGRPATIMVADVAITTILLAILFAGHSWDVLRVLVGLLAVFYGATFPLYGALAGEFFPRRLMGSVIGAWTPFYGAGAVASHWISGGLRDAAGNYKAAFGLDSLMAGVAFCVFYLTCLRSKEPASAGH